MLPRFLSVFAFGLTLLASCGQSKTSVLGLNTAIWTKDTYGCQNKRSEQANAIFRAKEQLYGKTTAAIEGLLGRPDEEELAEQTEKTYYYYLESGPQCEASHPRSNANKLIIHFGAIGTVTEMRTERPVAN